MRLVPSVTVASTCQVCRILQDMALEPTMQPVEVMFNQNLRPERDTQQKSVPPKRAASSCCQKGHTDVYLLVLRRDFEEFWNEPRDSLESNYKGWFVGLIPSCWTLHEPDSVLVQEAGDMLLPNKQNLGAFFGQTYASLSACKLVKSACPAFRITVFCSWSGEKLRKLGETWLCF